MTKLAAILYIAFEQGRAYERLYQSLDLYNVMNFQDIVFANSCGAEMAINGDMSDLDSLFKAHSATLYPEKIEALNKQLDDFKIVVSITDEMFEHFEKGVAVST